MCNFHMRASRLEDVKICKRSHTVRKESQILEHRHLRQERNAQNSKPLNTPPSSLNSKP